MTKYELIKYKTSRYRGQNKFSICSQISTGKFFEIEDASELDDKEISKLVGVSRNVFWAGVVGTLLQACTDQTGRPVWGLRAL